MILESAFLLFLASIMGAVFTARSILIGGRWLILAETAWFLSIISALILCIHLVRAQHMLLALFVFLYAAAVSIVANALIRVNEARTVPDQMQHLPTKLIDDFIEDT